MPEKRNHETDNLDVVFTELFMTENRNHEIDKLEVVHA